MHTTIFWPTDVKHSGYCYGWTEPAICVAGVLIADSEQQADATLHALCISQQWLPFVETCGSTPRILGTCTFEVEKKRQALSFPLLDLKVENKNYSLIYYYRHQSKSMRFYSLDILKFDSDRLDKPAHMEPAGFIHHDFTRPKMSENSAGLNFTVINQFNTAKTLETMIQANISDDPDRPSPWNHLPPLLIRYLVTLLAETSKYISFISHALSRICNTPIALISPSPLLKDISATIQQIDVRAEQIDPLVLQARSLPRRDIMTKASYSVRYVNFYNTVWLILNDITIGTAFGSFLCENHIVLARMLNVAIESILINWIQWALRWLDSWPAGLKLNTELSRFYSHTFIDLVVMWGSVLQRAAPYLPSALYVIGIISCGGMTLAISLLSDMLSLLTAHIYICYLISTTVYHRQLKTAGSLWNLFRGKRFNILRQRIDSWEYDIDQLLFGTMLFTLLAFLFPTVLAYYALFAMMRLFTILLHATMETLLALMNHFPLFALTLRAKDPWRLPGGVYLIPRSIPSVRHPVLVLKNQPVPFSSIFFQYIRLWSRLSSHYNPLRLLWCIFSGEYLVAIPRYSIRYDKIPEKEL